MERYDMLTELNAYRKSGNVEDLFHAVMGMAGRVIEADTKIVRLEQRVWDLEHGNTDVALPDETVTISKADHEMAVSELKKAREWLALNDWASASAVREGLGWALVALGQEPD